MSEEKSTVQKTEGDDGFENFDTPPAVQVPAGKQQKPKKQKRVPKTPYEKLMGSILRAAKITALPPLEELMVEKSGTVVKIKDIAVFTEGKVDPLLEEIYAAMPLRNAINFSAQVSIRQVKAVGISILKSGRMYQPIQAANVRVGKDKAATLECTSGRHRLAFLALAYGVDAEIPVLVEDLTLNQAYDAVAVANQTRRAGALEKAEHTVLRSSGGNADSDQDLYDKVVTSKAGAKRYCTFMVMCKQYPAALTFKVGPGASRQDGSITSIGNIEGYWVTAMAWSRAMTHEEFDAQLTDAIKFLNRYVAAAKKDEKFDPQQHLASMVMKAVGKTYRMLEDAGQKPGSKLDIIIPVISGKKNIARQPHETTYAEIVKALKV